MSLRLQIESMGAEGEGLAHHEGKVVFVPGALPGEDVEVELADCGKRHDRARLLSVHTPSPLRRASPCPHDTPTGCGGCSLLHMAPAGAAAMKVDHLKSLLARMGVDTALVENVRIPEGLSSRHRNHARFTPDRAGRLTWVSKADIAGVGPRTLVPVEHCLALHPLVEELRVALDGRCAGVQAVDIRASATTGECVIMFEAEALPRGIDPVSIGANVLLRTKKGDRYLRGIPAVVEEVQGVRLRVSSGAFFQGHAAGATMLADIVRELAGPMNAKTRALDLCSGVGLFALTSLRAAGHVVAVEADPVAAADLRANAASSKHVTVLQLTAEEAIDNLNDPRGVAEVLVVDPPRSGLGRRTATLLAKMHVPRVILVSCDPRNFVDEAQALMREGYAMQRCIPVDQFAGTHHLEMVALFTLG